MEAEFREAALRVVPKACRSLCSFGVGDALACAFVASRNIIDQRHRLPLADLYNFPVISVWIAA